MSAETILAVAFLVVAAASLVVHWGALIFVTRDGAGEWLPLGYRRVTNTLKIRVFGAALYTATGVVAVVATPITALAALAVFTVMTVLYAVSSIRDCRYWRHQRGQERNAGGYRGPRALHRPTAEPASRLSGSRPSPVPRAGWASEDDTDGCHHPSLS